jgi:predicted RNase H-like HicB family nuclease
MSNAMTYYVLIENGTEGMYTATVMGLPNTTVQAVSRQDALVRVRQILMQRLAHAEIVPLEIDPAPPDHPWMTFAGMFQDDPLFDQVVAEIEANRNTVDKSDSDL